MWAGKSLLGGRKPNDAIEETACLGRPSEADSRKKIGFGKCPKAALVALAAEPCRLECEVTRPVKSVGSRYSVNNLGTFCVAETVRYVPKDQYRRLIVTRASLVVERKASLNDYSTEVRFQKTGRGE